MSKSLKILSLTIFLGLFTQIFISINGSNDNYKISSYSSRGVKSALDQCGDYDGDVSIMYISKDWDSSSITYGNSTTNLEPANKTDTGYIYNLNRMDIRAYNITNGTGIFKIAEDILAQSSVGYVLRVAQEFVCPDLISVSQIKLYLNYSFMMPVVRDFYQQIYIMDESMENVIDFNSKWDNRNTVREWVPFWFYFNVLQPNQKYNIVFDMIVYGQQNPIPIDAWRAENYTKPMFNKGLTRTYDGAKWRNIENEEMRDMICNFTYNKVIDPVAIDLKFTIDNQSIIPKYQESTGGIYGGYEGFLTFNFPAIPSFIVNVTVTTNITIPSFNVELELFYIYLINVTGTYDLNNNQIGWDISYPYKNLGKSGPELFFLFERDWDFLDFLDPEYNEISELYFGPVKLFNVSYYGLFQLWGSTLETGTYAASFYSPNYCRSINPKVKVNGVFQSGVAFELGQTIILEAGISNGNNEPISGGFGQFIVRSPSGALVYNGSNLSAINGTVKSSDIKLEEDFEEGMYEATIFWTDGKEVGFYSFEFEVQLPEKNEKTDETPSELTLETLITIAIIVVLALAATPLALASRRLVRQRHWEKSLRNLFVLTKEGVNMYEYSFGIEIQDPALISGMISALTNFVREATGSKKSLRTIDQEDKKVILFHGQHSTSALLSDKDLPIIHKRIRKFTEAFEKNYGHDIIKWKGETKIFKGAEVIVTKYFPVDVEEKIIRGVRQKLGEFKERLSTSIDPQQAISIMHEITEFASRYQAIINKHYMDIFNELLKIAEIKIKSK